jgi:hypothetical protein
MGEVPLYLERLRRERAREREKERERERGRERARAREETTERGLVHTKCRVSSSELLTLACAREASVSLTAQAVLSTRVLRS